MNLLFSTIELLRDESCDMDLAGPTLPCLKTMLIPSHDPTTNGVVAGDTKYGALIHGLLSSCLSNIDDMRLVELPVTFYVS